MFIQKIILTQFKNYTAQQVELCSGINCFVGKNGKGKTNFLDAIYYLCMCKSHFNHKDSNIRQHGMDFFRLEGLFEIADKKEKIVAKVQPRKKKVFERNEVPYDKLTEHIGLLPIVMIVPDDTLLVTGGSELRRKLIDNTLSQLDNGYLQNLLKYNRLLKQRNAALKKMAMEKQYNDLLLTSYTKQMEAPAMQIFESRKAFLKDFLQVFNIYYQKISADQEQVSCIYKSQLEGSDFESLSQDSLAKDKVLARTTIGIHKDDLGLLIENRSLKDYASQGQLKSYVLALKLAQFEFLRREKKQTPILLLDDIFDKLDANRVAHLIDLLLEQNFGQVCITDTHENRLREVIEKPDLLFKMFYVEEGSIKD